MITQQKTKMCLDTFARYMSIHPLSFNSITVNNCIDTATVCESWMQFAWQNSSFISREMLAQFIRESENQIASFLDTFTMPTWVAAESHEWPLFYRQNTGRSSDTTVKFKTKWRGVQRFGQPSRTLLGAATVVYSDNDSDGFNETALFDVTVSELPVNLSDIYITYPNYNGDKQYRICPVEVVNVDTLTNTITFKGSSWNFVAETNITGTFTNIRYLDGCSNIFQESVEIWYEDINVCLPQIELVWTGHDICEQNNCSEYIQPACAVPIDNCEGIFYVIPQSYDTENCVTTGIDCFSTSTPPNFIRVFYQAGVSQNSAAFSSVEQAVVKLTASKLPERLCQCGCILSEIQRLQLETSVSSSGGLRYSFPFEDRINPFGTSIGAIETFKILSNIYEDIC